MGKYSQPFLFRAKAPTAAPAPAPGVQAPTLPPYVGVRPPPLDAQSLRTPPQESGSGLPAHFPLLPASWICIIRYHQLRDWGVGKWLNQLIMWTGLLCALGTSVVGNFQVRWHGLVEPIKELQPARVRDYSSQHPPRPLACPRTAFWDLYFSGGPWAGERGDLLRSLESRVGGSWYNYFTEP